jgi:hypothetical protein
MRRNPLGLLVLALCIPVLAPLTGCAIATDLVNADLLSGFGLDPATVFPSPGKVIVAFVNDTQFSAEFSVVVTPDPLAQTVEYSMGWETVPAGDRSFAVFDCPAAVVTPGELGDDFSLSQTAVTVTTDGGDVQVAYAGTPLESGRDFVCGDVIEMQLVQTGAAADAATFLLRVRVVPGS